MRGQIPGTGIALCPLRLAIAVLGKAMAYIGGDADVETLADQ